MCTGEFIAKIEDYSDEERFRVLPMVTMPIFIFVSCLLIAIWMKTRQNTREDKKKTKSLVRINTAPKDLDSLKGIFLLLATVVTIIGSQALLKL